MSRKPPILIVDDDLAIRKLLGRYLTEQDFRVSLASDRKTMHEALSVNEVSLVVLDVMLPDGSGLDICRDLRGQGIPIPIILLTALKEDVDRILGLEIGADDYLGKPFNPRELLARIRAVLRRHGEHDNRLSHARRHRFGRFTLQPGSRSLLDESGEPLDLTEAEFDLLLALVTRPGRPRQAVLSLIDHPVQQHSGVRAHAIVFAGTGRGAQWRSTGLPGLGLLLHTAEDIRQVREWLALTPPMLIVIEDADEGERKRLVAALYNDVRLAQTTIVSLSRTGSDDPVLLEPRRVQLKMSTNVSATSLVIVKQLTKTKRTRATFGFQTPWNEGARLAAVKDSGLLGSAPDASFDRLVRLAAHAIRAPIAMFTLVTQDEQWVKSRTGFE